MKKAFLDTNVIIAHIFLINSLHSKSESVFKFYSEFFWSYYVKEEFNESFDNKKLSLTKFFREMEILLENPNQDLYSLEDLSNFANKKYVGKKLDDAKNSINQFWNAYLGIQSQVPFFHMKNAINLCLNDLSINSYSHKHVIEQIMQLTPPRSKKYSIIDKMLDSEGVHEEDRIVTLDGHDFACNTNDLIDFVTFDDDCFNGAKNVQLLCFNSVKGKDDFKAS